jgi:hypothetical protein
MANFKVQPVEEVTPGLTYVTPEAMPAKFNNMTAAVQLADQGIKTAVAIDKRMVMNEARDTATELAEQYKSGSITNQQYLAQQKDIAQNNLVSAPEGEKEQYQVELNAINDKLSLMKEQGVISPEEFRLRLLTKTSDLANNNPAYANEIAKEVSSIMGNTGVNDLISMDASYAQQQAAAHGEMMKTVDSTLKGHGFSVLMPEEQKIQMYQEITAITGKVAGLKLLSESNEAIDSYEFEAEMIAEGGVHVLGSQVKQDYYAQMQLNINDPNLSQEEKRQRHIELVADVKNILSGTLSKLPVKPQYTAYFTQAIKDITEMETDLEKVMTGEYNKNYFANKAATAKSQAELQERLAGRGPEKIESLTKISQALSAILSNKFMSDDAKALELLESNTKSLVKAIESFGAKTNVNLNESQLRMKSNLTQYLPYLNTVSKDVLAEGDNLDAIGTEYNDILQQNEMILDPAVRIRDLDTRLVKLAMTTDSEVFNNLLTNNKDFRQLTGDSIDLYTSAILQETEMYPDVASTFVIDKSSGLVRTANLTQDVGNIINRLNVLIKFESKLLGVPIGQHAEAVVNRLFNTTETDIKDLDFNDL